MSQESTKPDETPAPIGETTSPPSKPDESPAPIGEKSPQSAPGKGSRVGAIIVLILIVASLAWYFVSDRLTPDADLRLDD